MLARAGFGNEPLLSHPSRKQGLAEAVVDLVRAGVGQVLALQINLCAVELLGHALGKVERGGAPGVFAQVIIQLVLKSLVVFRFLVGVGEFDDGRHERLGDKPPAELLAEMSF